MTTKLALVCDDHGMRVDGWVRTVKERLADPDWEVLPVSGTPLADMVAGLAELEAASKVDGFDPVAIRGEHRESFDLLDRADLVVFDSDLTPSPADADANGSDFARTLRGTIGDIVARQIRSFTTAGFITVVNMHWSDYPGDRVFDLTLMKGWRSYADLHLSEAELSSHALWTGEATSGEYHPWHWPVLRRAPDWIRRAEEAIPDLDAPVLATLGLDSASFSTQQADLFGNTDRSFRALAESSLGFRYAGGHGDDAVRRMASSVLRRWITRTLLVGQNVISDGPHLIARLAPLLGDRIGDVDAWADVSARLLGADDPIPLAAQARIHAVEPFVDRPVWDFRAARRQLATAPPRQAADVDAPDLVFAEDTSEHVDADDATSFETDVPGPYPRRYIAEVPGIDYEPVTRLL